MSSKNQEVLRPGTRVEVSGLYVVVGPRGGKLGREVTSVVGEPLPPTRKPNQGYVLVRPAQHKK